MSLGTEQCDWKRQVRCVCVCVCGSRRRGTSLPYAPCSASLPVILDRDDKEDQQSDALYPRQQEEVVVQRAAVDVTWKKKETRTLLEKNADNPNS